ncbi:MAG: hypothetical protein Q9167_002918 [Letrouitia subvulpina]
MGAYRYYDEYPPARRRGPGRRRANGNRTLTRSTEVSTRPTLSWIDGDANNGPSLKDLRELSCCTKQPVRKALELDHDEAFRLARERIKSVKPIRIKCLEYRDIKPYSDRKNLPFFVFNELDKIFFRSTLKGNVSLTLSSDLPLGIYSATFPANSNGNPRISIQISRDFPKYTGRQEVLAALLHQMGHAYYLQCCGFRGPHQREGHEFGHDEAFYALLKSIQKRLPSKYPLLLIEHLPCCEIPCDDMKEPCSMCYGDINSPSYSEIQEWRDMVIAKAESRVLSQGQGARVKKPSLKNYPSIIYEIDVDGKESPPKDLESFTSHPESFIFLCYDERNYPVPRSASVLDLSTLTKSKAFGEGKYLQLPEDVDHSDLMTLYFFLRYNKMYPPTLGNVGSGGPPQIHPAEAETPPALTTLISAFHLGEALELPSFAKHCLRGLESIAVTGDDPIEVLELVYCNSWASNIETSSGCQHKPVDEKLRSWVKSWLAVRSQEVVGDPYAPTYLTNLEVILQNIDLKDRLSQLLNKSDQLNEDIHFVQTTSAQKQVPDYSCLPYWQNYQQLREPPVVNPWMPQPYMYPNITPSGPDANVADLVKMFGQLPVWSQGTLAPGMSLTNMESHDQRAQRTKSAAQENPAQHWPLGWFNTANVGNFNS